MQSYLKKIIRIQQNKQIKLDFRNIVLMSFLKIYEINIKRPPS